MFLARLLAVVAGVALITLVAGSGRVRDAIGRHPRAGWFYVLAGSAAVGVALGRGGLQFMLRTLGAGLLFVALGPVLWFLFSVIDAAWSWSRRRAERRTLHQSSQAVPWR